jgi:hypothetical protein
MATTRTLAESATAALAAAARRRGFRWWIAAALILAGCVPAVLLTVLRGPGYEALLGFWLGPTALLSAWTMLDREGGAAREVWMWFVAVDRGVRQSGSMTEAVGVFASATEEWGNRSWSDLALSAREALIPRAQSSRSRAVRVFVHRNWYPVVWTAIAAILAVLFTALIAFS